MSTFRADVAAAARAVAARRLFLPLCQLGAGSRRVPSSRAACAPLPPRDITSLLGLCDAHTPRRSPRSCRPSMSASPLPPAPSSRVEASYPLRARRRLTPRAERAHRLRAASTSVASPCYSSSPRRPSPRHSPISCRPSAPTPPSPPSLSQRCDASCPFARIGVGSRRAPSSRAACAPLPPP